MEEEIVELNHSIMLGYKRPYNNHIVGDNCWCKPTVSGKDGGTKYRFHRNFQWIDDDSRYGKWIWIKEDE